MSIVLVHIIFNMGQIDDVSKPYPFIDDGQKTSFSLRKAFSLRKEWRLDSTRAK